MNANHFLNLSSLPEIKTTGWVYLTVPHLACSLEEEVFVLPSSVNTDKAIWLNALFSFLWVRFFSFSSQQKEKKCTNIRLWDEFSTTFDVLVGAVPLLTCLGFAPRSESFAKGPMVQVCSISSLSGLAHTCVVRTQIRSHNGEENCWKHGWNPLE